MTIQNLIDRINQLASRVGKFSVGKVEFWDLLAAIVNKIAEVIENTNKMAKGVDYLGGLLPTASAPTPAQTGKYEFTEDGAEPTWLNGQCPSGVKAGDTVIVVKNENSYNYTFVENTAGYATKIYVENSLNASVDNTIKYISKATIRDSMPNAIISTGELKKDGVLKHIVVKNNSSYAGYFVMTVYDNDFGVVFTNTTKAVLMEPNDEYVVHIGNTSVKQINFNNINHWDNYEVNIYNVVGRTPLRVGASRTFTKFTDGLREAVNIGNVDLFVDSGTYDIVAELTESYMSEMTAAGHYGPEIGHGVNVYFASGAKITCHYQGNDANVMTLFSPLNAIRSNYPGDSDYEIHNIDIDCSRVRYCVHDECSGQGQYTHKYVKCVMKLDNSDNTAWESKQCIGGGLGEFSTIILDGGEYNSVGLSSNSGDNGCITFHQPMHGLGSDFINKVIASNIYCVEGTIFVSVLGDGLAKSLFVCSNCSMTAPPYVNGLDNPSENHNFRIISWNNAVRS